MFNFILNKSFLKRIIIADIDDANSITKFQVIIMLVIIVINVVLGFLWWRSDIFKNAPDLLALFSLFHVGLERNLTTLYSGFNLFFSAYLALKIALVKRRKMVSHINYWRFLSVIMLLLSLDEILVLHEKTGELLTNRFNFDGILYNSWVIPGMIFTACVVAIFFKFVLSLPEVTRNLFLISGTLFVFGAIGMEMISGFLYSHFGRQYNELCAWSSLVEESLEMIGIIIFCRALMMYLLGDKVMTTAAERVTADNSFKS